MAREGGLATRERLLGLGVGERMLRRRLATGMLVRVNPRVFALPGVPLDLRTRSIAAALGCPDALLTGPSAAVLLGPGPWQRIDLGEEPWLIGARDRGMYGGTWVRGQEVHTGWAGSAAWAPTGYPRSVTDQGSVAARTDVRRPLAELMAPDWAAALEPVADRITAMGDFLRAELAAGRGYLPAGPHVLRAFTRPMADARVLIVGQDPYPTPGHAVGLSFCVAPDVRPIPRSLANIYRELTSDLGCPLPSNGDLTPWADRGVLLLNRVLTVEPGRSGSHRGKGWEEVTEAAIRALVARGGPLVAILWGRDAQSLAPMLGAVPQIRSAHPSPMSADRGFFGSRPFSRANAALIAQGAPPIDWSLP